MENEKRLIDANEVIRSMQRVMDEENNPNSLGSRVFREIIKALELTTTVDAVEVIRCKDCWKSADGLCSYQLKNVPGKDFCGDGERKE